MEILLGISIALLAGLLLSRLARLVNLPAVTAYLVAGILLGPYVLGQLGIPGLGFTDMHKVENLSLICDAALGFIAFAMGNEFRLNHLKKTGKNATIIGIFQACFTTLLVDAILIGLHFAMPDKLSLSAAIVLGAVASATAPAATMMVIRQYRAKGPLTDILMPIVALDDAVGLVLFSISFGIAKALSLGNTDILAIVLEPLLEVGCSLALGAVLGALLCFLEKYFNSRGKRISISVSFVLAAVALSMLHFEIGAIHVGFSSLLTCMMLGTVFANVSPRSQDAMDRLERWTAPILILFFTISGAELELSVFSDAMIVLIGIIYVIARSVGKYSGARISSKMMRCDKGIVKYLGVTLLPQAGVALGMAMKATELGPEGVIVSNIVLFAVLIYEFVGPSLTKISLQLAGEIDPEVADEGGLRLRRRRSHTEYDERPVEPIPGELHPRQMKQEDESADED